MAMWYWVKNGKSYGPVDETGLAGLVQNRVLTSEDLVTNDRLLPKWIPVKSLRWINTSLQKTPVLDRHASSCIPLPMPPKSEVPVRYRGSPADVLPPPLPERGSVASPLVGESSQRLSGSVSATSCKLGGAQVRGSAEWPLKLITLIGVAVVTGVGTAITIQLARQFWSYTTVVQKPTFPENMSSGGVPPSPSITTAPSPPEASSSTSSSGAPSSPATSAAAGPVSKAAGSTDTNGASSSPSASHSKEAPNLQMFFRVLSPSVPKVEIIDRSSGSGFLIERDSKRYVVTNRHVVSGGIRGFRLTFFDPNDESRAAAVVDLPPRALIKVARYTDLAVLELDRYVKSLPNASKPLSLTWSSPAVGDAVFVIGHPLGLTSTLTTGIVSGNRFDEELGSVLQISAAINPGNSGGPVFNADGQVIGVATCKLSGPSLEGLGFAIQAQMIDDLFQNRIPVMSLGEVAELLQDQPEPISKSPTVTDAIVEYLERRGRALMQRLNLLQRQGYRFFNGSLEATLGVWPLVEGLQAGFGLPALVANDYVIIVFSPVETDAFIVDVSSMAFFHTNRYFSRSGFVDLHLYPAMGPYLVTITCVEGNTVLGSIVLVR